MTIVSSPGRSVRPPAVAGTFYDADPEMLRQRVCADLDRARNASSNAAGRVSVPKAIPKAIIAPHAGHIYSGDLAAQAYIRLAPARDHLRRIVLIGPSHRVAFNGIALSSAQSWRTPLGDIATDLDWARERLSQMEDVGILDQAHAQEHCLEVHLPYLQTLLPSFTLVPLIAGRVDTKTIARVLNAVWDGPETALIISSDLSHFLDYEACRDRDGSTAKAIESLRPDVIGSYDACGSRAINGLLALAQTRKLRVDRIGLCNSGDTAGSHDRVVGYGAWAFYQGESHKELANTKQEAGISTDQNAPVAAFEHLIQEHGTILMRLAKAGVEHAVLHKEPPRVTLETVPAALRADGAAFVTLTRADGSLRGCIGSLEAHRPLAQDVADHGFNAACRDSRFAPVCTDELPGLQVSISVLTPAVPLPFTDRDDLLRQMRPGIDGLILEERGRRGLFLPQVWDQLPEPDQFLAHLLRKAGLPEAHWSETVRIWRFETRGIKDHPWPLSDNTA